MFLVRLNKSQVETLPDEGEGGGQDLSVLLIFLKGLLLRLCKHLLHQSIEINFEYLTVLPK